MTPHHVNVRDAGMLGPVGSCRRSLVTIFGLVWGPSRVHLVALLGAPRVFLEPSWSAIGDSKRS
eukprot:9483481-Pyramimonas_sp.AAC.1